MEKRFIGTEELAQYMDLSINTIYSWVCMRKIPFFKMGRLVKFDLKEIENWMTDMRVGARNYNGGIQK